MARTPNRFRTGQHEACTDNLPVLAGHSALMGGQVQARKYIDRDVRRDSSGGILLSRSAGGAAVDRISPRSISGETRTRINEIREALENAFGPVRSPSLLYKRLRDVVTANLAVDIREAVLDFMEIYWDDMQSMDSPIGYFINYFPEHLDYLGCASETLAESMQRVGSKAQAIYESGLALVTLLCENLAAIKAGERVRHNPCLLIQQMAVIGFAEPVVEHGRRGHCHDYPFSILSETRPEREWLGTIMSAECLEERIIPELEIYLTQGHLEDAPGRYSVKDHAAPVYDDYIVGRAG